MDTGRHLFLRRENAVHNLSPQALERIICRGLGQVVRRDIGHPPIHPLVNAQAHIQCSDVDVSTREVAFGRWAIPKLKKEVLSSDKLTAKRAILSLLDMVHDPEKAVEAIRLKVIPRLVRPMMSEDLFIQQHVLLILDVLSLQPDGKMAIVNHKGIMKNLLSLIGDENNQIRFTAAKAVKNLATWYLGVNEMIVQYFIPGIINRINIELEEDIMKLLLETLEMLLDQDMAAKQQGLDNEAIELAVLLEHPDSEIRSRAAAVMSQLTRTHSGKLAVLDHRADILATLVNLLDDPDILVKTHAAGTLMYVMCTTEAKLQCLTLGAAQKLLQCAQFFSQPGLQVNAIKALTSFAESPAGQRLLKAKLKEIQAIRPADAIVARHKDILITIINRVI